MLDPALGWGEAALKQLYSDFAAQGLMPLWTQRADLMPVPRARRRAPRLAVGRRVPAGRAGRRAGAGRPRRRAAGHRLRQPRPAGQPYATPTLWAAVQYLGPGRWPPPTATPRAPSASCSRARGWTVVDGDPVAMRRGDLLLTAAGAGTSTTTPATPPWPGSTASTSRWCSADAGFFEFGPDEVTDRSTPQRSRSERLWAHPGLRPLGAADAHHQPAGRLPLGAHRRRAGRPAGAGGRGPPGVAVSPGHAAVRFTNPTTGADALTTLRLELHRLGAGAATGAPAPSAGRVSVWQVFDGEGS